MADEIKLLGYSADTGFYDRFLKPKPAPKVIDSVQCCYCLMKLTKQNRTRDHLHPKSKGGKRTRFCCVACNQEKADMTMAQWVDFLRIDRDKQPKGSLKYIFRNVQYNRAKLILKQIRLMNELKKIKNLLGE